MSGLGDQHQYLWLRPCLSRGWGSESGIGTFLPFVVGQLGFGLVVLFGVLPLWLLGLARLLVGTLAPCLCSHVSSYLNLGFGETWPWPCLGLLSPQNGREALAFRFMLLGGLGLDRHDRTKQSPLAL